MLFLAHITALYLSWYGDPTSTMTVSWHTPERITNDTIYVEDVPVNGNHQQLNHLNVHTVHLENLEPDHEYHFRIGNDPKIYSFRTAPRNGPFRFVIGGDADYSTDLFCKMNKMIVEQDPLFCVIGGDIAYAVNVRFPRNPLNRWLQFLSIWKEQMITASGRIIPMVLGIGNHDITDATEDLFFTLFPIPERRFYRTLDFGNILSLILLDTDHYSPIQEQSAWLETTLSNRKKVRNRLAVYHEAAYPSHYSFDGIVPTKIRKNWCPLFEKYGVSAAFENHNHTYKKTYPINGVTYFGDGCWGSYPRKTTDMWYLQKRGSLNHVYMIDVNQGEARVTALSLNGEPLEKVISLPTSHQMAEHPK